jgi:hypothetical protein
MAFIQSRPLDASAAVDHSAARPKRGLFARLLDAIMESRQRQAEREIARLIELRGGKLTDSLEFQISQHALHGREPNRSL